MFTLYLPLNYVASEADAQGDCRHASSNRPRCRCSNPDAAHAAAGELGEEAISIPAQSANQLSDDSGNINPGDRVLLMVENDTNFAR